jgi:hypothetical protein
MITSPRTLAALLVMVLAVAPAAHAVAEELPPGFTDGQPVGEPPEPDDRARTLAESAAPAGEAQTAATTERYFGEGAWNAVRTAVAATPRSCSISNGGLTALVLAPVFKESSAATSPSTAPSPMTLSRYDEWNGVLSSSMGTPENNYGLYAFRQPSTPYKRAFWHPGLGIWQYDTAGLGAPLTTVEAMDVRVVAGAVATKMATNYCNAPSGSSDQERRYQAWRDWGYPCTLCEEFFDEMWPDFGNINLVPGIGPLGGVVRRECMLAGVSGTMPCWYVDPRVGVIQGATAWATLSPQDGGSTTVAPTPLSLPFYVLDRGATEERHWLRVDTGYSIDIRATRNIGKDARPRSTQAGSGLAWASSSGLCDVTAGRGSACMPIPPPGVSGNTVTVLSTNLAVPLDATGDGKEDVLWYGAGAAKDLLWVGHGGGSFASTSLTISGGYHDVLPGDIDGDGDDDVVVYNRSTGAGYLMRSRGDGTFSISSIGMGVGRIPFLLDADGDGDSELFSYGKDSLSDGLWNWTGSGLSRANRVVPGTFFPFVGDFDGNGRDDIFWYAPGSTTDKLWLHRSSGGYASIAKPVQGTYRVAVGDFDGDQKDDITWYAPGTAGDSTWFGADLGAFTSQGMTIVGDYRLVVASIDGSGRDGLILYAPGSSVDRWFRWTAGRELWSNNLTLPRFHRAAVGDFSAGGTDGILWYEPGATPDIVWYR